MEIKSFLVGEVWKWSVEFRDGSEPEKHMETDKAFYPPNQIGDPPWAPPSYLFSAYKAAALAFCSSLPRRGPLPPAQSRIFKELSAPHPSCTTRKTTVVTGLHLKRALAVTAMPMLLVGASTSNNFQYPLAHPTFFVLSQSSTMSAINLTRPTSTESNVVWSNDMFKCMCTSQP